MEVMIKMTKTTTKNIIGGILAGTGILSIANGTVRDTGLDVIWTGVGLYLLST